MNIESNTFSNIPTDYNVSKYMKFSFQHCDYLFTFLISGIFAFLTTQVKC